MSIQCIALNCVKGPICYVRVLGIVMLACVGCAPVAEPGKPSNQPVPSSITSASPADTSISADAKLANRQRDLTELLSLVRERLDLMPNVAQAKWNRKLPITDAKREATSLDALQAKGTERGLPPVAVREFFQAQITAAKLIQEQHFADWTASQQSPFSQPPDLEREIRPQIDKLNEQLLNALSKHWSAQASDDWKNEDLDRAVSKVFETPSWPTDVVKTALEPLRQRAGTSIPKP